MELFNQFIWLTQFFSRARAHTRSISLTICIVFSAFQANAADPSYIRGEKGRVTGLMLNTGTDATTREALKILPDCVEILSQASAAPMRGAVGSTLVPLVKAKKGVVVLEGVLADGSFKVLDSELLGAYKNFPLSMPAEGKAKTQYPLAITLAAPFQSQGNLLIQASDRLRLRSQGQLYVYSLPAMMIKSGGMMRLFLGADDRLYYDLALTHPAHAGACRSPKK